MSDNPNDPPTDEQKERERQERERAAMTPQSDHTPRQEEQHAREHPQQPADKTAARQAPPRDEASEEHDKEARAAATIGAQVILDYNSDASIGARGGAGTTIEENTQARDAHLVALGLNPADPTGPPPVGGPVKPPEPPPVVAQPVSAKATRMSSLAAGIITDAPKPEPKAPEAKP